MEERARPQFVLVLTTLDEHYDAEGFARTLVEERLAACVNVLPPMMSTYRWHGALETAREQQVIIKTTAGRLEALKDRLEELHPYDLPEVLVIEVAGTSERYGAWLGDL